MSIHALIFDVDGTLADTEEAHRNAFNQAFETCHLGWHWSREIYRRLLDVTGGKERLAAHIESLDLAPAEKRALTERVPEIHATKTRFYSESVIQGTVPLREGVLRLMEEALAAGCRLGIASTTTAVNVDALLQATLGTRGLEMFSVIACGDQVPAKKPAPDIYRLALRHLGLPAEEVIAFEDSPNGLRAAKGAGLWTVITPTYWTQGGNFSEANLVLPSLGEPAHPLKGEPGKKLRQAAWLGMDELQRLASPTAPLNEVQALYRGAQK
jgi:HAD superfamily hydrolase (TIGR01509 family)